MSVRLSKQTSTSDLRKATLLGLWSLTFATICQILYVPSLRVFYRERKMTCYKIMFFLGVADFGGVFCVGSLFGFTMIQGLVFCSNVTLSWMMGCGVCCCWYVSTFSCAFLVINRISELMKGAWLFQGRRCSICLMIILVYGVMVTLFTRLVYPNSKYTTVAFEAFIPGHTVEEGTEYPNNVNMIHNFCIAIVIPTLYIILCVIVMWRSNNIEASNTMQKLQARLFTQASIICFFNATTASAWIIQMFIPTPQIIITAGMITIQSVHGLPCIIYLALNRTVREELWKMVGKKYPSYGKSMPVTSVNMRSAMTTVSTVTTY